MSNESTNSKKPSHFAYHVKDIGEGRSRWTQVGAVWPNKDGGFSIQLDAVPLDGRLVCSPAKSADQQS